MKKLSVLFCSVCILLSSGLTACGSTVAKIYGVNAVVLPEEEHVYNDTLKDKTTYADNDYVLQISRSYHLSIGYVARGGSQYPLIFAEKTKLDYDDSVLEIGQPTESEGELIYYPLTCKKTVKNTAIIVEVDEYSNSIIISAK